MTQTNKIKLVTHDGSFHTDDVFAAATLALFLEKKGEAYEIIRSRDPEIITGGDYVFDVGGVYDPEKNKFDHHQVGGAGKRENEIEYASFGLVWKKFGIELCLNPEIVDKIDKKLATPIDAGDNGIKLFELKNDVFPYMIQNAFNSFYPTWKNTTLETMFVRFIECVEIAKKILINEIVFAQDTLEVKEIISKIYESAQDKRIIILDKKYPWYEQIQNYQEPIFVVYPRLDGAWGAEGVSKEKFSMEKKKNFPISWAGLRDEELQKITGVQDAVFCHRALFLTVAKSQEGAIKLAQIALESN